jgi:hypothetical protein
MTEPINPCEECSKTSCGVCDDPSFPWSLRIYQVEENGRRLFEFFIEKDKEVLVTGKANGFFSIIDQALEAVASWNLVPNLGESPSLTDLAFSTGVLVERNRAQKVLDEQIATLEIQRDLALKHQDELLELTREELDALITGDPVTFEARLKKLKEAAK